jgi:sirohydrochlorin cobaltochelatase
MNQKNQASRKELPIILTAFGTTARAFSTYEKMDAVFKEELPGHNIIWSYSSRVVKDALKKDKKLDLKDPGQVLESLEQQGHHWAVLQSLHLIGGHELHRLAAERNNVEMRTSLGLPLLSSPQDFKEVARALKSVIPQDPDLSILVLGHGTDHPSWTSYFALEAIMAQEYGPRVFAGVVEGYPEMDETIDRILKKGFKKVLIIPLLLVAGVHFMEDITGDEDSWQKQLEHHNIEVSLISHGVGQLDGITRIFSRHIKDALDVIPL